jgi:UDP-glucose:glycoprotein glucosyltransferase
VDIQLYTGKLSAETAGNISNYFYDLPTTAMRRNRHIYPSSSVSALRIVSLQQLYSRVGILPRGPFIYPRRRSGSGVVTESELVVSNRVPFTVHVVADLDSEAGLALMKEALDSLVRLLNFEGVFSSECDCFQKEDSLARISFIHNPANQESTGSHTSLLISYLVHKDLLSKLSPNKLLQALGLASVVDGDDVQTALSQEHILREISGGVALVDIDVEIFNDYMRSSRRLVRELRLDSGDHAVVVNGRVSDPFPSLLSLLSTYDLSGCWPY